MYIKTLVSAFTFKTKKCYCNCLCLKHETESKEAPRKLWENYHLSVFLFFWWLSRLLCWFIASFTKTDEIPATEFVWMLKFKGFENKGRFPIAGWLVLALRDRTASNPNTELNHAMNGFILRRTWLQSGDDLSSRDEDRCDLFLLTVLSS